MKIPAMFLSTLFLLSCATTYKIVQSNFDTNRTVFSIYIENMPVRGYLVDGQGKLIRNENDKNAFISNYNSYWQLDEKSRTNGFFNQYRFITADNEISSNRDLNRNYDYAKTYYLGIRCIRQSDYAGALTNFKLLVDQYPAILTYSDVSFLMAYCYEKLSNKTEAVSNYRFFVDWSVQRHSRLFSEDAYDETNQYSRELAYAHGMMQNSNREFPHEILSNDVAKINNDGSLPGFNPGSVSRQSVLTFGLGYYTGTGFVLGASFLQPINRYFSVLPRVIFSGTYINISLDLPVQVFKSDDHRLGIEITPIASYVYYYKVNLTSDDTDNVYDISHHVFNFGIEAGIGYYIIPSLYVGIMGRYMFYNQFHNFEIYDTVNARDYIFYYWSDAYYRICARYYFLKDIGVEFDVRNNELIPGITLYGMFIGYNINRNMLILDYAGYYW